MTTGHWVPLGLDRDDTTVMFGGPVFLDFLHRPGEEPLFCGLLVICRLPVGPSAAGVGAVSP